MTNHLGHFLKARREERGLSLGQVAHLLGYRNVTKGARRIHMLEQGEALSQDILARVMLLLSIDPKIIEELIAQDRQGYLAVWEQWANERVPIQIAVRCIPGVFGNHPVPADLKTPEEVVAYAQGLAKRLGKKIFLVLSRRITISVNEAGEVTGRHEATPDFDPRPAMRVGNRSFLLTLSPVDPATA